MITQMRSEKGNLTEAKYVKKIETEGVKETAIEIEKIKPAQLVIDKEVTRTNQSRTKDLIRHQTKKGVVIEPRIKEYLF